MQRLIKPLLAATFALLPIGETLRADDASAPLPSKKESFHIFLLMGQSNMAGYGGIPENDPYLLGDKDPVDGILVLGGQGTNTKADPGSPIEWEPAAHPLHKQRTAGFGLGLEFAKEYQKTHPGVTVGLIPCAWGGAAIDQLRKGSPVFTNAVQRIKIAQQKGTIKGVLWHQGESDSVSAERADAYEGKLRGLIADIRQEAGNPELPFLIGNLAEFYGSNPDHGKRIKLINQIRGILYNVGTTEPHCAFVASTGLEDSQGAGVHFNRESLIEFGKRYAKAFEELKKK